MAWRLHHWSKPEPVIFVPARVRSLDDAQTAVIADALPAHTDALDLLGGEGREVDVDQRPRRHIEPCQRRQHPLGPGLRGGERHGVTHAFTGIALAQRDRAYAG